VENFHESFPFAWLTRPDSPPIQAKSTLKDILTLDTWVSIPSPGQHTDTPAHTHTARPQEITHARTDTQMRRQMKQRPKQKYDNWVLICLTRSQQTTRAGVSGGLEGLGYCIWSSLYLYLGCCTRFNAHIEVFMTAPHWEWHWDRDRVRDRVRDRDWHRDELQSCISVSNVLPLDSASGMTDLADVLRCHLPGLPDFA